MRGRVVGVCGAANGPARRKQRAGPTGFAACAEGYSFPTNLDRDPPFGGMAPKTQQDLMRQALKENWPPEVFVNEVEAQAWRKLT